MKLYLSLDKHISPTINFTNPNPNMETQTVDAGEDVRFVVLASAFPDISMFNLTWFKDDQRIEFNDSHYNNEIYSDMVTQISFSIPRSRASDSGVYTLVRSKFHCLYLVSNHFFLLGRKQFDDINQHFFHSLRL